MLDAILNWACGIMLVLVFLGFSWFMLMLLGAMFSDALEEHDYQQAVWHQDHPTVPR